jgi:hypothetical protein
MMTTPDQPSDKIPREEERLTEDEIARRKLARAVCRVRQTLQR